MVSNGVACRFYSDINAFITAKVKLGLIIACLVSFQSVIAQYKKKSNYKIFQISLVPAVSSNGKDPSSFNNFLSLNIFSGISASNQLIEVAGISNLNRNETRGLQFAGLANLTGADAFAGLNAKAVDEKVKSGFEANLTGIQVSGLTNFVLNNVEGSQVTGGINISHGSMTGFQLAGIGNMVTKYSFGIQMSGLYNVSYQSMTGIQVTTGVNYTKGELFGMQIGTVNYIGRSEGPNSLDNDDPTGIQIGIVNLARKMNGVQIGLINFGLRTQGTQIGLINIYQRGTQPQTKDGTSLGLINVGGFGYASYFVNEVFINNFELTTGNAKNYRLNNSTVNKYIGNTLIYSRNQLVADSSSRWAIGYGVKQMRFNRSTTPRMSESYFSAIGIDAIHLNKNASKISRDFNLWMRLNLMAGTRVHYKVQNVYVYGRLSGNFYIGNESDAPQLPLFNRERQHNSNVVKYWLGLGLGLLIH